ncbi:RusA family crossover junction endodeoxyribonuclease [Paraburkholderia caribensis]|uniref:RusA family crossover junction endodeoxyribonuclease n=1 Tax=Paraburkholderia caribensis TaxID=75105 RepID=UPI000D168E92|nr:RusA family crossover junction endodeoxyribonuclease [Paraburkholderia caribensis]PTB28862.1 RusA family crossover junction endodeoxyribonuclease [Paraburkholderia caribensis]
MIRVTLPYPLSANKYWRPVPINGHVTIVPTKEAKEYKREVGWILRAARVMAPIEGRVHVHIDLYPKRPQDWQTRMRKLGENWDDGVQCLDIDNARKVLYDALKGIAIVDDKWIWSDSADRKEPDGEARVVLTITPLSAPKIVQAELALAVDPLEV